MDKATVESVMALAFELARIREQHGAQSGMYLSEVRALRTEVKRLAAQAAPSEPQIDSRFPAAHYGHDLQPSQAPVVQAVQPTQAVRMLTDEEKVKAWNHDCNALLSYADAVIRAFCAVNAGKRIPASGEIGGV